MGLVSEGPALHLARSRSEARERFTSNQSTVEATRGCGRGSAMVLARWRTHANATLQL